MKVKTMKLRLKKKCSSSLQERIINDIIEEIRDHQQQGNDEEIDGDDPSIEEIIDQVVERPSRSAIESAIDALKDAATFSDEGQQMKLVWSLVNKYWILKNYTKRK